MPALLSPPGAPPGGRAGRHPERDSAHDTQRVTMSAAMHHTARLFATAAVTAVLGATASSALAAGDAARGQQLYAVCSTCHGQNAEGSQEMNAPALAGREEWYLARQIENFRSGARGTDPKDTFGLQMAPMAKVLADKQAVDDVVAYLSSLKK